MLDIRFENAPAAPHRQTRDAKASEEMLVFRVHPDNAEPVESVLRWGLIPHHMLDRPKVQPINARAETISEKPMFADAYARRRCIVPMDAFYERDHGRKFFAFGMKSGEPFGVAGIWENWKNERGDWERTFCIITVPANELVGEIHDRMPAIIPPQHHARWFSAELDPRDLLVPYPAGLMRMWPARPKRR